MYSACGILQPYNSAYKDVGFHSFDNNKNIYPPLFLSMTKDETNNHTLLNNEFNSFIDVNNM